MGKENSIDGKIVTAIATPNIALIKYWGKADEKLIIPQNSSISITLGEKLNTKTSIVFSSKLDEDVFYINGERQDLSENDIKERFNVINMLRAAAGVKYKVAVVSENSFPTAAGLASSASGISAMVFAANNALELGMSTFELGRIARQGSGSSCRSLAGGFVKWEKGIQNDGSDSSIRQIAPSSHWPEIIDIIAIVSKSRKKVSSRAGMKQTVETSILYKSRPKHAENACKALEQAILSRDFDTLATITMRDSNNMHALMLDTWPPITYLNDVSFEIINSIHELNSANGNIIAAYTFDAGPNAHIITLRKNAEKVKSVLGQISGITELIEAGVGDGPRILPESESILEKYVSI
ncbi:MAG: diphosphomevalonate decarboxylase [Candidatus Micrarchaeia archaeon]